MTPAVNDTDALIRNVEILLRRWHMRNRPRHCIVCHGPENPYVCPLFHCPARIELAELAQ